MIFVSIYNCFSEANIKQECWRKAILNHMGYGNWCLARDQNMNIVGSRWVYIYAEEKFRGYYWEMLSEASGQGYNPMIKIAIIRMVESTRITGCEKCVHEWESTRNNWFQQSNRSTSSY